MNQNKIISLAAAVISFIGMGCEEIGDCERGRGPMVRSELQLPRFHSLKLSGSDKVIVRQGPRQEVWVEGQQNIIDLIRLEVIQGEWDIRTRGCIRHHERMVYYVTIPEVRSLSLEGSGDIIGEDTFITPQAEFEVTGSGSIAAEVEAQAVEVEITGSGSVIITGASDLVDIEVTGSGECDAYALRAEEVQVGMEGSGSAYVHALDLLRVDITGSGDVYYRGNPVIHSSISGSGKLIPR